MQAAPRLELTPRALPVHGDLSETPFAVLLGSARALGASGVLSLHEQKRVFFLRGQPVGVRTNFPEEISEVYMLRHGIVAESDLVRVRREAAAHRLRFGDALLGLGYLEADELHEHRRRHAMQNLTTCFRWEQGPIEWTERVDLPSEVVPVPLDLVDVFVTGVSRFYDRHRLDRELPVDGDARVYAKPLPATPTARAALGTLDARIFQLAAGRPTVQSLAAAVGLPDKTVRQRLYVLYCLGHIGFERTMVSSSAKPLSRIATIPAFGAASARPTGPYATPEPQRFATPAAPMPAAAVPVRRPTLPLASATPRPIILREEPTGVQELVEEASRARVAGNHHVAIATLRTALTKDPQNPVVLAELALTLMRCAPRLHAREANRLAREARRLDPRLSTSYVVMGLLMEQAGERDHARSFYRLALERDPSCGAALDRLGRLAEDQ
jgi:tetratricopeptide (TPR) repeat protein